MSGSQNENYEERRTLENRVRKEIEYRDRFMYRIRKARRKTYDKGEEEEEKNELLEALGLTDDTENEDEDSDSDIENNDDDEV
ncbi:MAG: hypothetical protein IJU82_03675 [Ruminiclostridium sp.]|nr:hypothetical protein [Ruminiclostridium sp.]